MTNSKANINLILCAIIALLIVALFIVPKRCNSNPEQKQTPKTAEIKGSFKSVKPEQVIIHDTAYIRQIVSRRDLSKADKEAYINQIAELSKENEALQEFYAQASDSLKKSMYYKAIELRAFSHTFENDTIKITSSGIVRGEVQTNEIAYKIKPISVEVPIQKIKGRVLAGIEVGNSKTFDSFNVKTNLGYQSKSGSVLSVGADTDKRFYIGYTVSLFRL